MTSRFFGCLRGRIIAMIALLPVMIFSGLMAHKTAVGPLQDALWDELPGIKRMAELGYAQPTPIPVILAWNRTIEKEDVLFLSEYTEYLRQYLSSGWTVSSLANCQTRTWDESWGEKIEMWSAYANPMLMADGFSMETWKKQVAANSSVFGKYVARHFQHLTILVGPPEGMKQLEAIREFRRVMQRNYPPKDGTWFLNVRFLVGDYLDTDFVPYREDGWPEILVGSLSVTETLITWAFFVDVDVKILFGYFLLLPFLFLVFRDPEYALPVWLGTLFAFLAALASVWPLSLIGMHYSVFLLPTLVGGVMIASLSFNAQLMEDIKRCGGVSTYAEWKTKAGSVKKSVNHIFRLTLICFAFFGFWYQSLWTAIVMDTVLAIGALWALVTQKFFLPALYFFVKARAWRTPTFIVRVAEVFENIHTRFMERKARRVGSVRPIFIYGTLGASVLLAIACVWSGRIDANSRQIEFLGDTHAKTMLNRMADIGRLDVISVFFEARSSGDPFLDETFLQALSEFTKQVRGVANVGNVSSVAGQIAHEINRTDELAVSFKEAVKLTRFGAKESSLLGWTEWRNGVFVWIDHPMKDAMGIHEATRAVEEIADRFQKTYPWLRVSLFGNNLHYAPLALITAGQAPWVLATSLFAILLYYVWMTYQECKDVPALGGGFVIAQPFLFVSSVMIVMMAACDVPLNIATAVIIPIVIAAASDANIYPAQEFFSLMQQKHESGNSARDIAAEALRLRGKAVDIDCAGNIMVLGLLLLSTFTPVWHLGMLSCVALLVSRWWSINFTLPQLMRLSEQKQRKEVTKHERLGGVAVGTYRQYDWRVPQGTWLF